MLAAGAALQGDAKDYSNTQDVEGKILYKSVCGKSYKKQFTHGWNDPPAEIKKIDSDNPLRRKKDKKTAPPPPTTFNAFNPTNN